MICFHHNDHDGFCSAAIVAKMYPECDKFKIMGYNTPVNWENIYPNEKVIIVDYSFSLEDMNKLLNITTDIIWIDHHKTAIDKLSHFDTPGIRIDGIAACELCWDYFFPNVEKPMIVRYIGDRDVWKFEFGEVSKQMYEGLERQTDISNPRSKFWMSLLNNDSKLISDIHNIGAILRNAFVDDFSKSIKLTGFHTLFENYKAFCLNRYISDTDLFYDKELVPDDFDLVIMFYHNGKKSDKMWSYSLRSRTINVSEIAEKFGGGGHTAAAGFYSNKFLLY